MPHTDANIKSRVAMAGVGAILVWNIVLVAVYLAWLETLPRTKADGTCDGVGFGCTPNPHDSVLLMGIFLGIPALIVGLLISALALAIAVAAGVRSGLLASVISVGASVLAGVIVVCYLVATSG